MTKNINKKKTFGAPFQITYSNLTGLPERPKFNGGTAKTLFSPGEKRNHILYEVEEDELFIQPLSPLILKLTTQTFNDGYFFIYLLIDLFC